MVRLLSYGHRYSPARDAVYRMANLGTEVAILWIELIHDERMTK